MTLLGGARAVDPVLRPTGECEVRAVVAAERYAAPPMSSERRIVATAANEFEAEMICGVLSEAGIESGMELANTGIGGRIGGGGARDIYVHAEDLERAQEALSQTEEPGEPDGEDG